MSLPPRPRPRLDLAPIPQSAPAFASDRRVTSTWTPEAQEQTDDSPELLQPAIVCKKGAAFVPVSFELFEDSGIAEELGRLLADAKLVQEALGFTITQTNGPVGIITSLVAAGRRSAARQRSGLR